MVAITYNNVSIGVKDLPSGTIFTYMGAFYIKLDAPEYISIYGSEPNKDTIFCAKIEANSCRLCYFTSTNVLAETIEGRLVL